jgi:PAS domain S-box-containing protein
VARLARDEIAFLASVLEATADGLMVVDLEGRITLANRRFAEMWRLPAEVIDQADDRAAIDHVLSQLADPEGFMDRLQELYAAPESESFDVIEFIDGRVYERYSRPQRVGAGILGRVWSFRDVTAGRAAQRRLEEAEERYRVLVEQIPVATYVDLPDGTPVYVSPQISGIYGCTREEWMSDTRMWVTRVHPEDVDRVDRWYEAHRQTGAAVSTEYRVLHPDGAVRWVHDSVVTVRDARGEPLVAQGVMIDITDAKAAEQRLHLQEAQLRDLLELSLKAEEDERSRIAAALHDDTIQVMAAAALSVDRILRSPADRAIAIEAALGAQATLREAIERTRRLTFQLRPPVLEHRGLAEALAILVEEICDETGLDIDLNVNCVRHEFTIEEIVYRSAQEALRNVAKHASASHVTVRVRESAEHLTLRVADDGVGFDLDAALPAAVMRRHFGLATMRERVRLAGGEVAVDSAAGRGTTLELTLPRTRG